MSLVKIKMNTWDRCGNRETKFRRNLAPREGFIEYCENTKKVTIKNGESKWKPWDTAVSRKDDKGYIDSRKKLYSGLCFESKKDAQDFINKHQNELNTIAKQNPLFDHWSIMNVIERFKPTDIKIYGKDIKED